VKQDDMVYWIGAGMVTLALIQASPFFWCPPCWYLMMAAQSSSKSPSQRKSREKEEKG